MKIVTNGSFITTETSPGTFEKRIRRFRVLAEYGSYVWVMPLNGQFTQEGPLTFSKHQLKECK